MIKDAGDLIRAVGFLAIYSGNLEDELDELYETASPYFPELTEYERHRFADKARHLRKVLMRRYREAPSYPQRAREEPRVKSILQHCKVTADNRNEIMHASIYSTSNGKTMLKNRRTGTRQISSADVYTLANETWRMHGSIYELTFPITRLGLGLQRSKKE